MQLALSSKTKTIIISIIIAVFGLTSLQNVVKADNAICQLEVSIPPHATVVRDVLIGENDYNFATFSFFANCDRDLVLRSLTITSLGSANFFSLRDLKIWNETNGGIFTPSSTTPTSAVFVPNVVLRKGSTQLINVLADVLETALVGKSISTAIMNTSSVDAFDSTNGVPVKVEIFSPPLIYDYVQITSSELKITQNPNTPPNQQINQGATNIPFAIFDFEAINSSVVINSIVLTKTGNSSQDVINNISLWVQGQGISYMIGTAQSVNANNQIMFSNLNHRINEGNISVIAVRGNVNSNAVPGQIFRISIQSPSNIYATDDINTGVDRIVTLPLSGNTMTIAGTSTNYYSNVIASTLYNPLRVTLTWDVYKGPQSFDGYSVYIHPSNSSAPMNFGNSNEIDKQSTWCNLTKCNMTTDFYLLNDINQPFQLGQEYKVKVWLYNANQSAQFPYSESDRNSMTYFAFSSLPNLPDLVVSKVYFMPTWNNYQNQIIAEICNRSSAGFNKTITTQFATPSSIPYSATISIDGTYNMPAQECRSISIDAVRDLKITSSGYHDIKVMTDTKNTVNETREDNNSLSGPVFIQLNDLFPDLKVEKIEYDGLENYGQQKKIQATICNRGAAGIYNVNLVTEFKASTGVNKHNWNGVTMDVNSCTRAFTYDSSLNITNDGWYNITATVDSDNKVVESNENNNSLTQNTYIDVNQSYPKPDLIVERIDYIPLSVGVRPAEIIEATVCNRGTTAMSNKNLDLEFKTSSGIKSSIRLSELSLGINGCISGYVPAISLNITQDGYYSITATADSLFEVSELFENNNSFSQNLYIDIKGGTNYLPDLVVNSVDFYPELNGRKNVIFSSFCNESPNPAIFSSNFSIKASYDTGMSSFTHDLPNQNFPANGCVEDIVSAKDIGINKSGYYTVLATVDSGKILSESNENNNTRKTNQFYVTIAGSSGQLPPPPANYEDPVLTNFTQYKNPFIDTMLGTLEGDAAAELYRRAVLTGFSNNQFRGYKRVDRAEIVKFMIKTRYDGISEVENEINYRFWDLQAGAWYIKYIVKAINLGIISGYSDGSFRPGKKINTAEFLKIMTLTFGLETNLSHNFVDVSYNAWYAKYAGIAERYDLFPTRGNILSPKKKLTRKDAVIAIYNYLKNR